MKDYRLWYRNESPMDGEDFVMFTGGDSIVENDGWEKWSLPLGNGYMGVNVFGRIEHERLQFTEILPSLPIPSPSSKRPLSKNGITGLTAKES